MKRTLFQIFKVLIFIIIIPFLVAVLITDYMYWDMAQGLVTWMVLLVLSIIIMTRLDRRKD